MNSKKLIPSSPTGHNSVFIQIVPNTHNTRRPQMSDIDTIPSMCIRHPPGMSHDPRVLNKSPEIIIYPTENYIPPTRECYENARDHLNYNTINTTWKTQKKYTL